MIGATRIVGATCVATAQRAAGPIALALLLLVASCSGDGGGDAADVAAGDGFPDGSEVFVPGDGGGADAAAGDADAIVARDGGSDGDIGPPPPSGYPAAGLLVRVVSPAARGSAAVASAVVPVHGLLFGRPDELRWETDRGDAGTLAPAAFWTIPGLALEPGDTVLTVTAEGPAGVASDAVVLTYNPSFPFAGPPAMVPPVLFAGEPTVVRFTVPLGRAANLLPESVAVHRVDATFQSVARVVDMADDGAVADTGDDVQGDGVYTGRATLVCDPSDPLVVRVALQATTASSQYRALSALLRVPCVERVTPARCEATRVLLDDARAVHDGALADDGGADRAAATAAAADWLAGQSGVAAAGHTPGAGVWLHGADGLLGAADLAAPGLRGGGTPAPGRPAMARRTGALSGVTRVGSRRALLYDPARPLGAPDDEIGAFDARLAAAGCPGFSVTGPHQDAAASLARLRDLPGHGIVALAAAAGVYFGDLDAAPRAALGWRHAGAQPVLWTGEPVDCQALHAEAVACAVDADCPGGARCLRTGPAGGACFDALQVDLALGRVVVGPDTWGVTPAFLDAHAGPLPDAVVYLGACSTLEVGGVAAALYAAGARAVYGWTGPVTADVATTHGAALLEALVGSRATGAALPEGATDPDTGGSLALFGAPDIDAAPDGVLDGSFEEGDLRGWDRAGDVRLLERLGATTAVHGQRFAVVSTGLGSDRRNGALRQTLCVPRGRTELTFWWKVISEELPLGCGSVNQDRFRAVVRGASAEVVAVDATIDDLCPPSACPGCGDDYGPLSPSDVGFDQGVASQTAWRQVRVDVQPFVGGAPVVLELTVSDQGDSSHDTAVLVDGVALR